MSSINGQKITNSYLKPLVELEKEKAKIGIAYNLKQFINSLRKLKTKTNLKPLLELSQKELLELENKIIIPALDRASKDNLKFTDRIKEIPQDFKNKIRVELEK